MNTYFIAVLLNFWFLLLFLHLFSPFGDIISNNTLGSRAYCFAATLVMPCKGSRIRTLYENYMVTITTPWSRKSGICSVLVGKHRTENLFHLTTNSIQLNKHSFHFHVLGMKDIGSQLNKRKMRSLTNLTRWPGVALISHVHSFLLGYLSGQLGLLMKPLGLWIFCSHSAVPITIISVSVEF